MFLRISQLPSLAEEQVKGSLMRGLMAAIGVMSVLIVVGVAVIGVTIVRRLGGSAAPRVALIIDEPAGTHISSVASLPDGMALVLQGGGPDRVVVLDLKSGVSRQLVTLKP